VPTRVDEIAREIADEYRAQAGAKQQALRIAAAGDVPPIIADPLRVAQIIANLVSNAVKYTPPGGRITVHVGHRPESVLVAVEDDGPGIDPDRVPLLFEEFTRFDPDAAQGAGIGLAISQKIARMLGGEITVESAVGRGSRFTLELPWEAPERRTMTREDRRHAAAT
jgi:signal transduction histidine kinase